MRPAEGIKNILAEQIKGYRTLLDVLQREREFLISLNAPQVEHLTKEKDAVVLRLRLLEEERVRLTERLCSEEGINGSPSLSDLRKLTGDESFEALRSSLTSLVQSISELNDFNRFLTERSLTFSRNTLGLFRSLGVYPEMQVNTPALSKEA